MVLGLSRCTRSFFRRNPDKETPVKFSRLMFALLLLSTALGRTAPAADWNWPQWRGPNQDGHTKETGLPTKWDDSSVVWKAPLKGEGQSSPVVWGERIFLTQSRNRGRQRVVLCINRNDGRILWEKTAWTGTPEATHNMNGWASSTPVTDGKHVYALFGKGGGLFCYTVGGSLVWNKELGAFKGPWGTAASPVLHGDYVILNGDADANSFLAAYDKTTGKQVWRMPREDKRGWSTPIFVKVGDHEELVINGHSAVRGYDPKTGKELWRVKSFNGRGSPTVTPGGDGLLFVLNGLRGDFYAVKPGGSGDATATHMVWHTPRGGGRDLPSPIAIGKYVLAINMRNAVLTNYDAASGKELYKSRVGKPQYTATPISYDGLALFLNESGETLVVKPGPKLNIVARNRIKGGSDEIFRGSITPSDGQLFIRSTQGLYCVGKRKSSAK
jgi:outer membrane protein assembly factor BamB